MFIVFKKDFIGNINLLLYNQIYKCRVDQIT